MSHDTPRQDSDPAARAERNERLLANISQLLRIINQKGLKFEKRLRRILSVILGYLGAEHGSIMLARKNKLVVTAATRAEIVGKEQPLDGDSISAIAATTAEPIFVPDITKDKRFTGQRRSSATYKKNSLLSVPIVQDGKVLAVINVTDKKGDHDLHHEDISCLLDLSSLLIAGLVRQDLQEDLRRKKNILKERNRELKRQEQLRDELYRMLIHDLKAPLAEVVANLDILSYSIDEENREFLEAAQMSCDRTLRMISNLITINKIEDGKLTPCKEEIEPGPLLEEALSAIRALAAIKKITTRLEVSGGLPTIYLDRVLILRVLQNLLTNALGYSEGGTTVTLGCRPVPGKKKLEFFVQDQGPGLDEGRAKNVFDKYSRLSDKQDALVGTGLGLYFCKLAVEVHRGRIGIETAPGKGCRFFFRLPL